MDMGQIPSFDIVDSQEYLSERQSNLSTNSHKLPPQFIISLSYKPLNNTVLSLFSVQSSMQQQIRGSKNQNVSNSTRFMFNSSIILSDSTVLMMPDSYYVLWSSLSDVSRYRYTINLIVMDGRLSTCFNGQYLPSGPQMELWSRRKETDRLQMKFTPYLKSVSSLVRGNIKAYYSLTFS